MSGLLTYLDALFGWEPASSFIEFREKRPSGMRQQFVPVRERAAATRLVESVGRRTDLYIGVAPRTAMRGGKDAVERVHVLWTDCDTPEAIKALDGFSPAPPIVVNSGRGRHAYWPLWEPVAIATAEASNKRLAHALGADERATDAARILRPPGTLNLKNGASLAVELVRLSIDLFTVEQVVGDLAGVTEVTPERVTRKLDPDDALMEIPASVYVPALTGREVGRDGKARCPFHAGGDERTPSLHAYDDAAQGYFCFGCDRGGTIIDFGAQLYGIEPRGAGFRRLREKLEDELLASLRRAA